jgi:AbrB family looped-hinge helix DNA binding protein
MTLVKLSSKGQVVVPKDIREALGLAAGTVLKVSCEGKHIILEPVTTSMIERLYGKFAETTCLDDLEAEHQQEIQRDLRP